MEATGRLRDGTAYRPYAPPLPLDERWQLPDVPDMLAIRDRWVNLRASLVQSGQLDTATARLVTFWHQHGVIPRPVELDVMDGTILLFKAGIDTALAASSKTNFDVFRSYITETSLRQAADILVRLSRENSDISPLELAKLHSLVCRINAPNDNSGQRDTKYVGAREGSFRSKPIFVLGTDWVMKEGAPPRQIVPELLKIIQTHRAARVKGVPALIRAAWLLYAFSVVHPFYDGNGKLARMLATMVLVRGGRLPLIMPPSVHRAFFETMAQARNGQPQMLIRLLAECQVTLMESAFAALT
jgi:hypothetical protein